MALETTNELRQDEAQAAQGAVADDKTANRATNDWRWLLLLFTAAGIVESQAFGHFNAFTPLFLQELRVPANQISTWTGILGALGFVIGLPLLPFWGVWADRYGRKIIIVRAAFIEGLLFAVAALSPNVWALAVARLLVGFVFGNTGVMLAMLAEVTPRKQLGFAIGIASAGFPLGSAVGPLLGGLIAQALGIRALLGVDALASALMGVALTLFLHERHKRTAANGNALAQLRVALAGVFESPLVTRLFLLYLAAMFGVSLATPFIPIRIQQLNTGPQGQLPSLIGVTLTAAGIAMAVTTPLWGRLGDALGRWRLLPVCVGAVGLGLAAEALAPRLFPLQGAIVVVGLFQGGIGATVMALLALLAPERKRNVILNFSLLPAQLSWFLGPISGAALSRLGVQAPFAAGAVALFVALAFAVALALRQRGERVEVAA